MGGRTYTAISKERVARQAPAFSAPTHSSRSSSCKGDQQLRTVRMLSTIFCASSDSLLQHSGVSGARPSLSSGAASRALRPSRADARRPARSTLTLSFADGVVLHDEEAIRRGVEAVSCSTATAMGQGARAFDAKAESRSPECSVRAAAASPPVTANPEAASSTDRGRPCRSEHPSKDVAGGQHHVDLARNPAQQEAPGEAETPGGFAKPVVEAGTRDRASRRIEGAGVSCNPFEQIRRPAKRAHSTTRPGGVAAGNVVKPVDDPLPPLRSLAPPRRAAGTHRRGRPRMR